MNNDAGETVLYPNVDSAGETDVWQIEEDGEIALPRSMTVDGVTFLFTFKKILKHTGINPRGVLTSTEKLNKFDKVGFEYYAMKNTEINGPLELGKLSKPIINSTLIGHIHPLHHVTLPYSVSKDAVLQDGIHAPFPAPLGTLIPLVSVLEYNVYEIFRTDVGDFVPYNMDYVDTRLPVVIDEDMVFTDFKLRVYNSNGNVLYTYDSRFNTELGESLGIERDGNTISLDLEKTHRKDRRNPLRNENVLNTIGVVTPSSSHTPNELLGTFRNQKIFAEDDINNISPGRIYSRNMVTLENKELVSLLEEKNNSSSISLTAKGKAERKCTQPPTIMGTHATPDLQLRVHGLAQKGSTVKIFNDGVEMGTAVADSSTGEFTVETSGFTEPVPQSVECAIMLPEAPRISSATLNIDNTISVACENIVGTVYVTDQYGAELGSGNTSPISIPKPTNPFYQDLSGDYKIRAYCKSSVGYSADSETVVIDLSANVGEIQSFDPIEQEITVYVSYNYPGYNFYLDEEGTNEVTEFNTNQNLHI